MKKFLPLMMLSTMIFTACPGLIIPKNRHSIARIKEKYACNIELVNNSSYKLHYKYAPVPTRKDFDELPFVANIKSVIGKIGQLGFSVDENSAYYFNVYGLIASKEQKRLYTGVDAGPYAYSGFTESGSNSNLDGLPARFVIAIDGENNCYSLVVNCADKNSTTTVEITNAIIERLKSFSNKEFSATYNGRREWYGKSVKIQDDLYCFSRHDFGKNLLVDYSYKEGISEALVYEYADDDALYGRIPCYYDAASNRFWPDKEKEVLLVFNDTEEKFYYVKTDASVNLVE